MGKEKKEKRKSEGGDEVEEKDGKEAWTEKIKYLSPISKPLAHRKLTKRLYKVIRKGELFCFCKKMKNTQFSYKLKTFFCTFFQFFSKCIL